ncbi:MAG: excinuclease ABC subunit UvrB, partial [Bdellovibrionales bacterium]|nr:excinuclease ABC subunit UvrB [Bdellovibrionales bacterium]
PPNNFLWCHFFVEFRVLFQGNAVEFFVIYYDYYQREAYLPATNTYIEKDASINEQIDLMRHSATRSLLERKDVIIVSSISCIYGLGSPEHYGEMVISLEKNQGLSRDQFLKQLVEIQYKRNDMDFHRSAFRVRGDTVEVFPAYEQDCGVRVEFFGDYIDQIVLFDPLNGQVIKECLRISIYPSSHYVSTRERIKTAIDSIREELRERLNQLEQTGKHTERERLEQRTLYDLEILSEMGSCPGVENYSRHLTGRKAGEPPPTLLEYFHKKFITFIDESHITVPQAGAMYRGDRSRKLSLVEHGFRLPSALDNRPLNFQEFENSLDKVVYVSATPGKYERESKFVVVEQIIRPTGLVDPEIFIRPAQNQVDDLLGEIQKRIKKKERVLVTTLTKKMAESLTSYYQGLNIKAKYLHSDIKTIERTEIIQDLRAGVFDVLVGINLLREGLDLPEVSLVAILDADQEGFLRSGPSLIQTIGRAARHIHGKAVLYADRITPSMKQALDETNRRRQLQQKHNEDFQIKPKSIKKSIRRGLAEIYGFNKSIEFSEIPRPSSEAIQKKIQDLTKQMKKAAEELNFEEAARLRDRIKGLHIADMELLDKV